MDHLLADYGSCSSSSSSDDGESPPPAKRRKTSSAQNDTVDHSTDDRVSILTETEAKEQSIFVRNDPHIRGNWAGLVYFSLRSELLEEAEDDHGDDEHDFVSENNSGSDAAKTSNIVDTWTRESTQRIQQWMLSHRKDNSNTFSTETTTTASTSSNHFLVIHTDPHISLTKPFYLQKAFIPSFLQRLRSIAEQSQPFRVHLTHSHIHTLRNDARQRTFFAWPIRSSSTSGSSDKDSSLPWCDSSLIQWTKSLDQLLRNYQQPAYYDPPLFHASFASTPGDWPDFVVKNNKTHVPSNTTSNRKTNDGNGNGDEWEVWITHVHCRLGNQIHVFALGKDT